MNTCPTCNGPMALLFVSSYCPACEKASTQVAKSPAPIETTKATQQFDFGFGLVPAHQHPNGGGTGGDRGDGSTGTVTVDQ
jgi:hypothetical protein